MSLAEKIIALRKQNDISSERLALELGVTHQTVTQWESGEKVPEKIIICRMVLTPVL